MLVRVPVRSTVQSAEHLCSCVRRTPFCYNESQFGHHWLHEVCEKNVVRTPSLGGHQWQTCLRLSPEVSLGSSSHHSGLIIVISSDHSKILMCTGSCSPKAFWPGIRGANPIAYPVDGLTHRQLDGANDVKYAPLPAFPNKHNFNP